MHLRHTADISQTFFNAYTAIFSQKTCPSPDSIFRYHHTLSRNESKNCGQIFPVVHVYGYTWLSGQAM